jgi:hypothetical protein
MLQIVSDSPLQRHPIAIAVERARLGCALRKEIASLERLRIDELSLRESLTSALRSLCFYATQSKHRIETRQFADGVTHLDAHIERARSAEHALVSCISEIERKEIEVANLRSRHEAIALQQAMSDKFLPIDDRQRNAAKEAARG